MPITRFPPKPQPIQVALSPNGEPIEAGTFKGYFRVPIDGEVVRFEIDCNPNEEPSSIAVQVDLNRVDRTTGAATSILSAVASIATGENNGVGTIDGTQSVEDGDLLSFDIDQGSDGQDLIATVFINPSV